VGFDAIFLGKKGAMRFWACW